MTYTAIWIVAWLLNGTPVSFSAVLPGNAGDGLTQARMVTPASRNT